MMRILNELENLGESGAISEEEAEARKRAAKDQTEAKNKSWKNKARDCP